MTSQADNVEKSYAHSGSVNCELEENSGNADDRPR